MSITTKPLQLTLSEIKRIERSQSRYGCGADSCVACYPLQYGCEYCGVTWHIPIRNSEVWECVECEWVNNAGE